MGGWAGRVAAPVLIVVLGGLVAGGCATGGGSAGRAADVRLSLAQTAGPADGQSRRDEAPRTADSGVPAHPGAGPNSAAAPNSAAGPSALPAAAPPRADGAPNAGPAGAPPLPPAALPGSPNSDQIVGWTAGSAGKLVALTFDDGPSPLWTPQFLGLLASYHVRATFCLIGQNVARYPALVRQIAAAGDVLCDHTMTHDEWLPRRSADVMRAEIGGARQTILNAVPGAAVPYYRAPGGNFSRPGADPSVQKIAAELGMQSLAWSIDTRDWTRPGVPAIVDAVERSITTRDVVLMHDGGGDRAQTFAALRILLPWLVANGYHFDIPG